MNIFVGCSSRNTENEIYNRIAEEIGYTTPNKEARAEQSDDVKNNPGAYMPQEIMDKCEGYKYLTQDQLKLYDDIWMQVKG